MTDDLIERLRTETSNPDMDREAAAALEARDKRIADLGRLISDATGMTWQERCGRERIRAEKAEDHLGNLLALLHRDGGHYQGEHGTDNAVGEATMAWSELILRAEKAEADLAAARAALDWMYRKWMYRLGEDRIIPDEHAAAIAAARGEKTKSDVCPTCEGERTISVKAANGFCSFRRTCPDCGGTGKKETK